MTADRPATKKPEAPAAAGKITSGQQRELHALLRDHGISGDKAVHAYLDTWLAEQGLDPIESRADLPDRVAAAVIRHLHETPPVTYAPGGLVAAIVAIQKDLPLVAKTKTARVPMRSGGEYTYSYADLADVTAAALPLLTAHQVAWMCWPRQNATGNGYELVGELLHVNGESRQGALPLHGNDPQVIGGALTYFRRYLLGAMLGIVTDDDPDARATRGGAPATQQYDGPSTLELLAQIDNDGKSMGMSYEDVTAEFRRRRQVTVEQMDALDPWELASFAEHIHNQAEAARAKAAEAASYVGPTTAELLLQIDAYAGRAGVTYEQITAKWRYANGDLSVDDLDALPPQQIAMLEQQIATYLAANPPPQQG